MTDARAREAERRFATSGSPEDEAALLRERARTGALDRKRLLLAARLGDVAARLAQPEAPPFERPPHLGPWAERPLTEEDLISLHPGPPPLWAAPLLVCGPEVLSRFVLVVIRDAPEVRAGPSDLALLEATLFRAVPPRRQEALHGSWARPPRSDLFFAPDLDSRTRCGLSNSLFNATYHGTSLDDGWAAACREVADWLLGRRDLLRERVEARETHG